MFIRSCKCFILYPEFIQGSIVLPIHILKSVPHPYMHHTSLHLYVNYVNLQEHVLTGGHGLMVNGYDPVIKTLARDLDIHLHHRYAEQLI
jgi:hypothetical protein